MVMYVILPSSLFVIYLLMDDSLLVVMFPSVVIWFMAVNTVFELSILINTEFLIFQYYILLICHSLSIIDIY